MYKEWEQEPDRDEFPVSGYTALILRNPDFGTLNGYIGIPEGHPKFGKTDGELSDIPAHGSWTYTKRLNPETLKKDGFWWIGFDCMRAYDYQPNLENIFKSVGFTPLPSIPGKTYRNIGYVRDTIVEAALALDQCLGENVHILKRG